MILKNKNKLNIYVIIFLICILTSIKKYFLLTILSKGNTCTQMWLHLVILWLYIQLINYESLII